MWRKVGALAGAALIAALFAAAALAATPVATLTMASRAQVDTSTSQPRISLSADGDGWHLDATILATASPRRARAAAAVQTAQFLLTGTYTLSHSGISPASGNISGTMGQDGTAQLNLGSSDATTDLAGTVSLETSGSTSLNLTGQLPALAATAAGDAPPADHTFWYISRAAGLTAYLLLTLNVCLGLMVRTRALDWLLARWRSFDLHQFTALLALGFLALHVFSLLGDHFIGYRLDQLLIPFASPYRPPWVALGVVALYLLIGIAGSSYLQRFISHRAWRAIHYLSFAAFLLALGHGILAGTDSGQPWAMLLYTGSGGLVAALTTSRLMRSRRAASLAPIPIPS